MAHPSPSQATDTAAVSAAGVPVKLSDLVCTFGNFVAVTDVNLDIEAGEFLTLLGPSGSGKTTTLSMIAGFNEPARGSVSVNNVDVTDIAPHKRNIGMVFQQYSLFPHMDVLTNVAFPLKQRGVKKAEREKRALAALELVELADKASSAPRQLSGGQQQRVAIARALVFSPGLLLMDEPFGALDRALREKMQIEIRRIHQELGVTIIFVTHDQQEALTMSDRIAVFNEGKIIQIGTPEQLYEHPENLTVATFLGESNLIVGQVDAGEFRSAHGMTFAVEQRDAGEHTLFIRPENIELRQVEQEPLSAAHRELPGTIRDIAYMGSDKRVEVATAEGTLIARISPHLTGFQRGAEVLVSWNCAHERVFPGTVTPQ